MTAMSPERRGALADRGEGRVLASAVADDVVVQLGRQRDELRVAHAAASPRFRSRPRSRARRGARRRPRRTRRRPRRDIFSFQRYMALGIGRLLRHRVGLHPLLAGAGRLAVGRGQVAGHLRHPLGGMLVVGQHHRVPVELEELGDPPQVRLGVGDEVLVAQLEVVARPCGRGAGRGGSAAASVSATCDAGAGSLSPSVRFQRESATSRPSRITWMNRASGIALSILHHVPDVGGRLLAVARLALALGVDRVEGAQRRAGARTVELLPAGEHLGRVDVEVAPLPDRRHRRDRAAPASRPPRSRRSGRGRSGSRAGSRARDARRASAAASSCRSGRRRR